MIKQKIANGEGFIEVKDLGMITAVEFDQRTEKGEKLTIISKPTKHDYKIVNDKLVLLTKKEKLSIEKEKKKKQIAEQLLAKYPEKIIDGTIKDMMDDEKENIDNLKNIKEVKQYRIKE